MSNPQLQSPLHSFALAREARVLDASCGVWANEDPLKGYVSLRGEAQNAAFVESVSRVLGLALPVAPCTFAQSGSKKVLWLSPDEWMIVCPRDERAKIMIELAQALAGIRSQVADNSGGYTEIVLQGPNAQDVLGHTTVYNIAALEPGRVVGTTFGKTFLFLHRADMGFCLLVRRSFADYIWHMLVRSVEPYGLGILKLTATGNPASGSDR